MLSPSEGWPKFTDSKFSAEKHLTPETKKKRGSSWFLTAANLTKMYVGIAFISVPMSIEQAGLYGSIIGFIYIVAMNLLCIYILLKARNRFKREVIVDIADLADKLYGGYAGSIMSVLLVLTNSCFLMAYVMFFGSQVDQLSCKTFGLAECGYDYLYALGILTLLLPICFIKSLSGIGYFSIVILVFTFIAIGIIVYLCIVIIGMTP